MSEAYKFHVDAVLFALQQAGLDYVTAHANALQLHTSASSVLGTPNVPHAAWLRQRLQPAAWAALQDCIRALAAQGGRRTLELRVHTDDGPADTSWVLSGHSAGVVGTVQRAPSSSTLWADTPLPMFCTDLSGLVQHANPALRSWIRAFTGEAVAATQGRCLWELAPALAGLAATHAQALAASKPATAVLTSADNKHTLFTCFPLRDSEELIGVGGVSVDVTAYVERSERLRAFIEHAPVPIFIKDRHKHYIEINPAEHAILGQMSGKTATFDVLGKHHRAFDPVGAVLIEQRDNLVFESRQPAHFEDVVETPEGVVAASVSIFPTRFLNGEVLEMGGFALNISDRYRVEKALAETNRALAASNEALRHFAHAASHDLRAPLRTISRFSEIIVEDFGDSISADMTMYLRLMQGAAARMGRLLADLLSYTRLNAPAPAEQIDLNELMAYLRQDLSALFIESGATLECPPLPVVPGVRSHLRLLWQNLLTNAIKFRAAAPPRIVIQVTAAESEWAFSVQDNGIGVDPEHAAQIFEAFVRLHSEKEYGGTGLGLAMCARIAQQHGGRIWLDTNTQAGATLHFTLARPLHPSA